MTAAQALRRERRMAEVQMRRQRRIQAAKGAALIALLLMAFALAGTMDYQDAQTQAEYWEELGVTLRGW